MVLIIAILAVSEIVALAWLIPSFLRLRKLRIKLRSLAKDEGLEIKDASVALVKMRTYHVTINSERSLELLKEAELIVPQYLLRMRVFAAIIVVCAILLTIDAFR